MHRAHITRLCKCLTAMGDRTLSQLTCLRGLCLCFVHSNSPEDGKKTDTRQRERRGARNIFSFRFFEETARYTNTPASMQTSPTSKDIHSEGVSWVRRPRADSAAPGAALFWSLCTHHLNLWSKTIHCRTGQSAEGGWEGEGRDASMTVLARREGREFCQEKGDSSVQMIQTVCLKSSLRRSISDQEVSRREAGGMVVGTSVCLSMILDKITLNFIDSKLGNYSSSQKNNYEKWK